MLGTRSRSDIRVQVGKTLCYFIDFDFAWYPNVNDLLLPTPSGVLLGVGGADCGETFGRRLPVGRAFGLVRLEFPTILWLGMAETAGWAFVTSLAIVWVGWSGSGQRCVGSH